MRAIIVDDENKACKNLESVLHEYIDDTLTVIGIANSTAQAETLIKVANPDVVFLDIDMPEENAFQFLARISPVDFEIIFVTAYDEFAIKAFRLNAVDYILKPIRVSELKNAVEKLKERHSYKEILARSDRTAFLSLSEQVSNSANHHSLTIRHADGLEIMSFRDIHYAEAQGSYSRFVFVRNQVKKEVIASYPLSYFDDLLPGSIFFRIHRSYVVNICHIKSVLSDSCCVLLANGASLPVSRRRFSELLEFLRKAKSQSVF